MMSYFAHQTAVIDEGCQIGKDTKIWHFCHLMPEAVLGERCILGQNVFIGKGVQVGNGVKIQNNVSLYTGLSCEDDVFIGPSAVFTNVINPRSAVERKEEFKDTLIKKGATIGANATVICGLIIGKYAMVGAGSVVTKSVPDYGLAYGNPARLRGWVSRNGHKLNFGEEDVTQCPETGQRYQRISSLEVICLED